MFGNTKSSIKQLLIKLFLTPKEDIFRFAKINVLFFICSIFYDLGISYSVFKYAHDYFMNYEANSITKLIFSGNTLLLLIAVITHVLMISYILYICKKYKYNNNFKIEKKLMISANLFLLVLATGSAFHILGGTSWLVF